jgi:signal transduction histidine kinase
VRRARHGSRIYGDIGPLIPLYLSVPSISTFIRENSEPILQEWENFARQLPMGAEMDVTALRDHAKAMLGVIARDLETPQTARQADDKAKGGAVIDHRLPPTAAAEHGLDRADSGFSVEQMVAEFRALRASVVRLWTDTQGRAGRSELDELIRFNEAIDQAIAESLTRYTHSIAQTKERFLAILGHDLRTPIGAILMSAQFLADTGDRSEQELKIVKTVERSARRMKDMVSALIDFARTRFGDSIPVEPQEMDVGLMLRDIVSEVRASHPESEPQLEITGPLRGEWDCERLTQAVTNLVSNAVEHGSNSGPIRVAARGSDREVVITVQNDGPPIPRDRLGRIFEAGTTNDPDRRHLGLGLYIVDRIVAAHGGTIEVESSEDQGTAFTVRLPK